MKKLLFTLLFLTACTTVNEWSYTPLASKSTEPQTDIVLLHPDLRDLRGAFEVPVEATALGSTLRPVSYFAQATALELTNTGYFQSVEHVDEENVYTSLPKSAFVLEGNLKTARINLSDGRNTFGILGLPFWLIGIPYGKTENVLEIHYRVRNATSQILFEKTYTATDSTFNGFYYHPVKAEFEQLVQKISLQLAEDLKRHFSDQTI